LARRYTCRRDRESSARSSRHNSLAILSARLSTNTSRCNQVTVRRYQFARLELSTLASGLCTPRRIEGEKGIMRLKLRRFGIPEKIVRAIGKNRGFISNAKRPGVFLFARLAERSAICTRATHDLSVVALSALSSLSASYRPCDLTCDRFGTNRFIARKQRGIVKR